MQPVFIVVEADPIVLQDLTEILTLSGEGVEVAGFTALSEAADWLDRAGRVDLVFLGTLDTPEVGPTIARGAEGKGARIVLVGERTRTLPGLAAPVILETPFTNASVTEFVSGWRNPQAQGA